MLEGGDVAKVIEEAKRYVQPSPEEVALVNEVTGYVLSVLKREVESRYKGVEVSLQGSIAKNTWLSGARDIDVFVIFPRDYSMSVFERLLSDVIDVAGRYNMSWVIRYAQHPYVQLRYRGFEIDVVPCFRMYRGEKPITAADRTPLHTEYVKSKLSQEMTVEVRLLKRFLKRLNIYGAELKVEGFSGYLAELLIIRYGSFINLIRDVASSWRPGDVIIDIESHYAGNVKMLRKMFRDAVLIVVDPVDPRRNVAASVSLRALSTLIAAAKQFLRRPSLNYFVELRRWRADDLRGRVIVPTLLVLADYPRGVVPETVWGELKKFVRSLGDALRRSGFKVYNIGAWSDDESKILIMIMAESLDLPPYEIHKGPPVYSDASLSFIDKYVSDSTCIGPFIRGSRWYVIRRRRCSSIEDVIRLHVSSCSAKYIRSCLQSARLVRVKSVEDVNCLDESVSSVVVQFMMSRPDWMT